MHCTITRNNYAYANNNPVNFVDSSGHVAWLVPAVKIGITALAAISIALIADEIIDAKKDYDAGKVAIRRNISKKAESSSSAVNESFISPSIKYGKNQVGKRFYYSTVATVTSQKNLCEDLETLQKQTNSRIAHAGLDLAGMFVDAADFINAGLYALEGNYDDAAIALGAGVFAFGTAATVNKHILKNADELADAYGGLVKNYDESFIKTISYNEYENIYKSSIHNSDSDVVMLGKYDAGKSTGYIAQAGYEYTYFSIDNWNAVKEQYGFTDDDMFKLFNEPFLDDGINAGKTFKFSHNPIDDTGALGKEYSYLLKNGYVWDRATMTMRPKF